MPDDVDSPGTKATTTQAMAAVPRNYFEVGGRGFTVGQKIIYTDRDGVEWPGVVRKHTDADVTGENASQVKMIIHVPRKGENTNIKVTYPRVRAAEAPASGSSGGAGEGEDDEDSATTVTNATTAVKMTKAPKTVLTVNGRSFVVGQRVIYTDKNGGQFRATVKKHTEATVTDGNADKVKMGILIDGEAALTHVTYPRVRDQSEDPLEEEDEEESASKDASVTIVSPPTKKRGAGAEKEGLPGGKKLRGDEAAPPAGYMTQAEVQGLIAQALQEKVAQDNAGIAQLVQAEVAKGLFDKGTQGDRLQKRNSELTQELQEARHTLGVVLQDRRELRKFVAEFSLDIPKRIAVVVNRVNRLLPGEEEE
jgi:hypothetical protein